MNIPNNGMLLTRGTNGAKNSRLFEFAATNADDTAAQIQVPVLGGRPMLPAQFVSTHDRAWSKVQHKAANSNARAAFLRYILTTCDVVQPGDDISEDYGKISRLPDVVREAMKCTGFVGLFKSSDWKASNQRPLTARRIKAVMEALEVHKRETQYGAEMPPAVRDIFRKNPSLVNQWSYEDVCTVCQDPELRDGFVAFFQSAVGKPPFGNLSFKSGWSTNRAALKQLTGWLKKMDGLVEREIGNVEQDVRNAGGDVTPAEKRQRAQKKVKDNELSQWQRDDNRFVRARVDGNGPLLQGVTNPDIRDPGTFSTLFDGANLSTMQKARIYSLLSTNGNGFVDSSRFRSLLGLGEKTQLTFGNLEVLVNVRQLANRKYHFTVQAYAPVYGVQVNETEDRHIMLFYKTPPTIANVTLESTAEDRKTYSYAGFNMEYDVTVPRGSDDIEISNMSASGNVMLRGVDLSRGINTVEM